MRQLTDDSVMRSIATVKTTKTNKYQKLVSAGGAKVNRGTEGTDRTTTDTPTLNEVEIVLNPIYAYPKTTQEILDFSEVDILGWLTSEVADTFAGTEEDDFVNGDGTKKSKGFLSYVREATPDKTRAFGKLEKLVTAAATIAADELIDLLFKLKAKYRKNAVWVMNSQTAAALQKLKNSNGDYIWRDRLVAGSPDMLLGQPVQYLETMPDIGAGKAPLAVGDFKRGYFVVDHTTGVRIHAWRDLATVWAEIRSISGRERMSSGAIYSEATVRIWARYRDDITTANRILYRSPNVRGQVYSIVAVIPDVDNSRLELLCKGGIFNA